MNHDWDPELDGMDVSANWAMHRREFLQLAGAGIFLFFAMGELPSPAAERAAQRPPLNLPNDFNAYLKIGEDGRVTCYTGKIEMGQGVVTSLAQMLAEELDVPLDAVDMVMGDTDLCPWDMGTFGSMTTRFFGPALRAAGAEARRVLLELASNRLKVSLDTLVTDQGAVIDKRNPQSKVSYAQLAQGKKIIRHLTGKAAIKKPSEFKVMSRPARRKDAGGKVTGTAKYAGDIRLPGMVYAKILRPPAHGARLMDFDLSEAKRVSGVQIIQEGDFVAILHKYPDVAELALSKIKAKFDKPASDLDETKIFEHLLTTAPEGTILARDGDPQKGAQDAVTLIEEIYGNDYVAHAPIEPRVAVVNIEGNRATVWGSTQTPFRAKEEVASVLGLPPENVRVRPVFLGGGFGGKSRNLQIVEAARCAKLCGKPVQVAWTRKEEFFYDFFRPAAVVKIKSGLTDKGRISLWDYHVYFAGERGAQQFYAIPNHSTTVHGLVWQGTPGSHPFPTGAWRSPSNNTNTFARESQIDIMAARAGIDSLEFRQQNLTDKKMQSVLKVAADRFGWKPAKPPSGRGYGIACSIDAGTYVATIAEVEVEKTGGTVKVKRVVCAQDMGLAVNPEGAAMQMEGCITMGLGYALKEQIHFKGGEIFDRNFDTYEIPRFSWLPKIETVIIDNNNSDPQGGGEPPIVTMGAVLANAVYDAIGVRLFQLPMSPERIEEAWKRRR